MPDASNTIIELEKRFWQALVAGDTNTALSLLAEPAVMVNGHGALQFTRAQYRQMAQEGPVVVTAFTLDDMTVLFANDSTAVVTYRATQHVAPREQRSAATAQVVNDSSTWIRDHAGWKCVMHTETPVAGTSPDS